MLPPARIRVPQPKAAMPKRIEERYNVRDRLQVAAKRFVYYEDSQEPKARQHMWELMMDLVSDTAHQQEAVSLNEVKGTIRRLRRARRASDAETDGSDGAGSRSRSRSRSGETRGEQRFPSQFRPLTAGMMAAAGRLWRDINRWRNTSPLTRGGVPAVPVVRRPVVQACVSRSEGATWSVKSYKAK